MVVIAAAKSLNPDIDMISTNVETMTSGECACKHNLVHKVILGCLLGMDIFYCTKTPGDQEKQLKYFYVNEWKRVRRYIVIYKPT